MSVLDKAIRTTVPALSGEALVRIPGLIPGTLYATFAKGFYGARSTDTIVPDSAGPGGINVDSQLLTAEELADIAEFATLTDADVFPTGFFVAGASANYARTAPEWSVDTSRSTDTTKVIRVALPDFNQPTLTGLDKIRMRISRDGGVSTGEVQDVYAPFPGGLNYAVFKADVPYDKTATISFQGYFKDGTVGRFSDTLSILGVPTPLQNNLVPPVMDPPTGAFVYDDATNSVKLQISTGVTPDPHADQVFVSVTGNGKVVATSLMNLDTTQPVTEQPVTLTVDGTALASYVVNAYSMKLGAPSVATAAVFTTNTATPYKCAQIAPEDVILEQIISTSGTTRFPALRVQFPVTKTQPKANIYFRRRDTYGGNLAAFEGFTKVGTSTTGTFLSNEVSTGLSAQWDVVVCAVGVNGQEAEVAPSDINTVSVQPWGTFAPSVQALPTVTFAGEHKLSITGEYVYPSLSPYPVSMLVYKSETSLAAGDQVAVVPFVPKGDGDFRYQLDINDIRDKFTSGTPGTYHITLRPLLENGYIAQDAAKTVVKVVYAAPSSPTLSSAVAFGKTVKLVVENQLAAYSPAETGYTPGSGGNGTLWTVTPAREALRVEFSDGGVTPGTNPEVLTPAVEVAGTTASMTITPANYAGEHNCRVRWISPYGESTWSNAISVTFAPDNVVDNNPPNLSTMEPRFTCNSDGSIHITWQPATAMGVSGIGSYIIRRATTALVTDSIVIATISTKPGSDWEWVDSIEAAKIGSTFYYWMEALNGQGTPSVAAVPIKLQSAETYTNETTVAAVSLDSPPADVAEILIYGAVGGFNVKWTGVLDRDLLDYVLEFSELGDFSDSEEVYISGTSYFQTLGAAAPKATADNYRWRIKARDRKPQLSAGWCVSSAPDNTNYGSVADIAPNAPQGISLTNNEDGSITITITPAANNRGEFYRILRRYKTAAGWVEDDAAAIVENDIILPTTATTYRDSGLKKDRYYNYRVWAKSKLGTLSESYVAATAPLAAVDLLVPTAPACSSTPEYGLSAIQVTPAEAFGTVELWYCTGGTWNAGSAIKISSAEVGPVAHPIVFRSAEADSANPVTKTYAARQVDAWGNTSPYSTPTTCTAINWLRADLIEAEHLKAGSISVEHLQVGTFYKPSIVTNGHFGTYNTYGSSTSGWTLGSGTTFLAQGKQYTLPSGGSLYVPRFSRASAGSVVSQELPVIPGMTYTVVGIVYNDSSNGTTFPSVSLCMKNASTSVRISSATSNASPGGAIPDFYKGGGITAAQPDNSDTTPAIKAWHLVAYKVTVPTNVTSVLLEVVVESFSGGGNAYVYPSFIQMYADDAMDTAGAQIIDDMHAVAYGGDVSGSYDALTVRGIHGRNIDNASAPQEGDTIVWNATASKFTYGAASGASDWESITGKPELVLATGDQTVTGVKIFEATALQTQSNSTDLTARTARLFTANYNLAHLPVTTFFQNVISSGGYLAIGGGSAAGAATLGITFWIGASANEAMGTQVASITSNGLTVSGGKAFYGSGAGLTNVPLSALTFPGGAHKVVRGDGQVALPFTRVTIGDSDAVLGVYGNLYVALTEPLTAPRTLTIPAASGNTQTIIVADEIGGLTTTNSLTILPQGSDTFMGSATTSLNVPRASVSMISNGIDTWQFTAQRFPHTGSGNLVRNTSPTFLTKIRISPSTSGGSVSGDLWVDSDRESVCSFVGNMAMVHSGVIFTQTADSVIPTTTGTDHNLLGTGVGGTYLPSDFFKPGKTIRIRISGVYSTTANATNITFKVKLGSTTVCSSAATAATTSQSGKFFEIDALLTCRSVGVSGTVMGSGRLQYNTSAAVDGLIGTTTTAAATVDTTSAQTIYVTLANSANGFITTTKVAVIEVL